MVAIARAASSRVVRRAVAKRCGNWVWSMMPTDQPSASSQILRVCLPSTFMRPEIAAIHANAKAARPSPRRAQEMIERRKKGGGMPIGYEGEYKNQTGWPWHAEIFARWAREAEDYRAQAMQERRAELGLMYGSSLRQFIDLFSPRPDVTSPLALFIHGGYWRSLDPSMFSQMARGLNARGVAGGGAGCAPPP